MTMNTPYLTRFARLGLFVSVCSAILVFGTGLNGQSGEFNHPRNTLITDQFNNRGIEIDPAGDIVWQYGGSPTNVGPSAIVGTNDAERIGGLTLMAGTGIPPGATPNCPSGCVDNRVLLVNHFGKIVWQYGTFGVTVAGANQLNVPVQDTYLNLANGQSHVLITDQCHVR